MNVYPTIKEKYGSRKNLPNERPGKQASLYLIYASQLMLFRDVIGIAKQVLSQDQIWPDQCDYIVHKIKPLQKTANSIAELASKAKRQDGRSQDNNHYSTLVCANYFSDQIERFVTCIQEYKEIADRMSSKKSARNPAINSLHHLDLSFHDLMKELDNTLTNS